MAENELDIRTAHAEDYFDAIDLASDQDQATWVTDGGKRVAAIVPVEAAQAWLARFEVSGPELPEPDLREHVIRLHPDLHSAGKVRLDKTNAQMAFSHAGDHRDHGSTSHRHGPAHWESPGAWPAGWRDGSGVVRLDGTA